MKILSTQQIREADKFTIKNEPIASIDLMERASEKVAKWILTNFSKRYKICVLAGNGNNGGDGLAVARMLANYGYKAAVLLVLGDSGSDDFNENLHKLQEISVIRLVEEVEEFSTIHGDKIYIDAIFGSGLSRDIEKKPAEIINKINITRGVKISIDIPSGIYADQHSTGNAIFQADHTLSFQTPKLAFMMPENHQFVGEWHILDIGLHKEFLKQIEPEFSFYKPDPESYQSVSAFSHKGNRGRLTVIAGGYGKMGAAVLVLKGALHSGIGLLTAQVCNPSINVVQVSVPEALILKDENEYVLGTFHDYSTQDIIVMGPAIGLAKKTRDLLEEILKNYRGQLILDADALNILSENRELLELLPENTILTPHPGEFNRLVGKTVNDFDRIKKLKAFCQKYKVVTLLKGRFTAVCNSDGQISFNSTGNSGMAKGGSGDLLCGIIAGIYPRVKKSFEAAKMAAFLHGLSGDYCKDQLGENSMSSGDMIEFFGKAERSFSTV
ncbi:NAD(P)H-hydrate dehydratase [Marivirga sp. S37H4]|uniref:Bifunctional NAD(P)H-hydrate repair enzyme n=1 Tax=Marivirga aurantiaca TaxID=2802615 RepID=A0A935C6J7_9BACT|nr:NAD(P)H-hydrate dehydratase [Marivirga aurantiaca]MBK6263787.1 NAD(P)H-hydrate dehydratase [Marivirga aurantiaca]